MGEPITAGFPPDDNGIRGAQAKRQGDATASVAVRLARLERFLSGYREVRARVEINGEWKETVILVKNGGREVDRETYPTTIAVKDIFQKDGVWRITFFPVRFQAHSLSGATLLDISTPDGGTLFQDPPKEITFGGNTTFYLKITLAPNGDVTSVEMKTTDPKDSPVVPIRPGVTSSNGTHGVPVGMITFENGVPRWKSINSDATLSCFLPGIESGGDGERLYDTWNGPNIDVFRSIRGANEQELEEDGYYKLRDEFASESSGFEYREQPFRLEVTVKDSTLILKGKTPIVIPNGAAGSAEWLNCGGEAPGVAIGVRRGIITREGTALGNFEACGCDECGTTTYVEGP